MPNKSERRKSRVFRRTAKGTRMRFKEDKHSKKTCGMCNGILHGVPHGLTKSELTKRSKTQRRPTGIFSGVLCGGCREKIMIETVRVKTGMKGLDDVQISWKKYVEQAQAKVE